MSDDLLNNPLLRKSAEIVSPFDRIAASLLMRKLSIRHEKAEEIIKELIKAGILAKTSRPMLYRVKNKSLVKTDEEPESQTLDIANFDPLFEQAAKIIIEGNNSSIILLQKTLKTGYARTVKIFDELEAFGVIGPSTDGKTPRAINFQTYDEFLSRMKVEKLNARPVMICKAFIVDLLGKRYMLHIWTRPRFSVAWHRKRDGLIGKLLWIEKYNK